MDEYEKHGLETGFTIDKAKVAYNNEIAGLYGEKGGKMLDLEDKDSLRKRLITTIEKGAEYYNKLAQKDRSDQVRSKLGNLQVAGQILRGERWDTTEDSPLKLVVGEMTRDAENLILQEATLRIANLGPEPRKPNRLAHPLSYKNDVARMSQYQEDLRSINKKTNDKLAHAQDIEDFATELSDQAVSGTLPKIEENIV